jgi:hypothetical protein
MRRYGEGQGGAREGLGRDEGGTRGKKDLFPFLLGDVLCQFTNSHNPFTN